MTHRIKVVFLVMLVLASTVSSCRKPDSDDDDGGGGATCSGQVQMTPYTWYDPARFPKAEIPADNEMYVERIALGKKLFYDTRLSNNGESCETCHKQNMGFSASGVSDFDKGLQKMPLVNLAWYKNFMWSGRIVGTLEEVMHAELTKRFSTDFAKINAIQEYKDLFCRYYGTDNITAELMSKPLAQFMRVLVSKNNKYDRYLLGLQPLTLDEDTGRAIFFSERGDCFHCHVQVLATDNMLHNNGIDSLYAKDIDKGYFNVTGNPAHLGMFRTPNLRNVALRTEYMHDGRFKTLEEVVEFYDHQVHIGVKNIDPVMLKPGKEDGLNLTPLQKKQLVAFLKTLTDDDFINNAEFKP
ncbi:MAG: hypothetical protein JNK00_08985 [Flavipsychrobacter sp.]|nr:hypothetical protein [Flavipsychrobacter sp.]